MWSSNHLIDLESPYGQIQSSAAGHTQQTQNIPIPALVTPGPTPFNLYTRISCPIMMIDIDMAIIVQNCSSNILYIA